LGMCVQMYVDDTSFYPCLDEDDLRGSIGFRKWPDALQPYYRLDWTNRNFHCPGYRGGISTISWLEGDDNLYGSYAYNDLGTAHENSPLGLGYDEEQIGTPPPLRDSQVLAPSDMIGIMDSRGSTYNPLGALTLTGTKPVFSGFYEVSCALSLHTQNAAFQNPSQHGKNFNLVFCDAHVKSIRITDLFNPAVSAVSWNYDHQPHRETWH